MHLVLNKLLNWKDYTLTLLTIDDPVKLTFNFQTNHIILIFIGAEYWDLLARKEIRQAEKVYKSLNENLSKNVIIFIGDGMSLPTLTASRIYKAQKEGRERGQKVNGEESLLFFETFPHAGLSKVIQILHSKCI